MAGKDGIPADRIRERLAEEIRQFAFFQLVHLLERSTGSAPLGYQGPASRERIRFRADPSLACPPGDLLEIQYLPPGPTGPGRYEITVSFLGLYGPASPLPAHYTEAVIAADLDNTNRRDFLDYFHQRLISFFYRSWKKYRYYANFTPGAEDDFSQRIFALFGGRSSVLRSSVDLDWERLLACSGLFAMVGSPGDALERTVSYYFHGLPSRVEPLVEQRILIEPDQHVHLGRANSTLGQDMTIGRSVRDCTGKFRLVLGPMSWDGLNDFLPVAVCFDAVVALVRLMLTDSLAFDLVLLIDREEVRRLDIAKDNPCRLGWTTWLGNPEGDVLGVKLSTG